jgi:hypothetical protein
MHNQINSAGLVKSGAEAFLERGDKVAATARDLNHPADLVAKYGNNVLPTALIQIVKYLADFWIYNFFLDLQKLSISIIDFKSSAKKFELRLVESAKPKNRSRSSMSART